jgi:hypothetical protein
MHLSGIEPMISSSHFGNVTRLIETRWYRPHSTPLITRENAAIWTFLIDPHKGVFAHMDYFRIARHSLGIRA